MINKKILIFFGVGLLCFSFLLGNNLTVRSFSSETGNLGFSIDSEYQWGGVELASIGSTGSSDHSEMIMDSRMYGYVVWEEDSDLGSSGTDKDIVYAIRYPGSVYKFNDFAQGVVSTESDGDSVMPSIAIDSEDNKYFVWADYTTDLAGSGGDDDIFCKRWYSNGTWGILEVVSTESTANSMAPKIALDSMSNLHVAWSDYTNYTNCGTDADIFYKMWNSTSESWFTTEVVSTESTDISSYLDLAVDSDKNVHVCWLDWTDYLSSDTDTDVFYKYKDADTQNWSITEVVSDLSTGNSGDPSIAVDGNDNIHFVWWDATDYEDCGTDLDIFHRVYNGYSGWSKYKVVSTESNGQSESPTIMENKLLWTDFDNQNLIHIVWRDSTDYHGAGTDFDIFYKSYRHFSRYDESENIWSDAEVVSVTSNVYAAVYPSLYMDDLSNIYVTWGDEARYADSGSDRDIFFRKLHAPYPSLVLNVASPNPTSDGFVELTWKDVPYIMDFRVWRNTEHFWEYEASATRVITGVDENTSFIDALPSPGTYYYRITAQILDITVLDFSNLITVVYTSPVLNEFAVPLGIAGVAAVSAFISYLIFRRKKK